MIETCYPQRAWHRAWVQRGVPGSTGNRKRRRSRPNHDLCAVSAVPLRLCKPYWVDGLCPAARACRRRILRHRRVLTGAILTNGCVKSDTIRVGSGATDGHWPVGNGANQGQVTKVNAEKMVCQRAQKGPWQGPETTLESALPRSSRAQLIAQAISLFSSGANDSTTLLPTVLLV
jgi:hypothetical protein